MSAQQMSAPVIDIVIDGEDEEPRSSPWLELPEIEAVVERAAVAALAGARRDGFPTAPNAGIAILLTSDEAVRVLNRDWRGLDKPTNVLSFPAAEGETIASAPFLGDIALAYETVSAEAKAEGKTLTDHLCHLVIHGVLHLVGYDHQDEEEAEAMEGLEIAVLAGLGIADPYAEPEAGQRSATR